MNDRKDYTLKFNEAKQTWKAKVRKPDGSGWADKWLPKSITKAQETEAHEFMVQWTNQYTKTWVQPENSKVVGIRTLATLFPRWIKLRENSIGTRPNTLDCFKTARNWILDTEGFRHDSIQNLDIETGLTVQVLRSWLNSIPGKPRTKAGCVTALSSFFNDAVGEGWLNEDFINPFQKVALKKLNREIASLIRKTRKIHTVPIEQMNAVLTSTHRTIRHWRKVRYVLGVLAGLRDGELNGLVWGDLHLDSKIPYVSVLRQLDKRGVKPFKVYEDELAAGKTKAEIFTGPRAVVSDPKTGASKGNVPLHPLAVKVLRWWWSHGWEQETLRAPTKTDPVFPRPMMGATEGSEVGSFQKTHPAMHIRADLERAGFKPDPKITFHALRRTFASALNRAGVDDARIDRLMRHSGKSVARQNYIEDDLAPIYTEVCKLELSEPVFRYQNPATTKLRLVAIDLRESEEMKLAVGQTETIEPSEPKPVKPEPKPVKPEPVKPTKTKRSKKRLPGSMAGLYGLPPNLQR